MNQACLEAQQGIALKHGGPFGASLVCDGTIIASAHNTVLKDADPTCHAEINVIRLVKNPNVLKRCTLYTTCEPCPMCLGAIVHHKIPKVIIGVDKSIAATFGFDDQTFLTNVRRFYERTDGIKPFQTNHVLSRLYHVGKAERAFEHPYTRMLDDEVNRCLVVMNDKVIHSGPCIVTCIRETCRDVQTHVLDQCTVFCLVEPTPFELGALYWARVQTFYYALPHKIYAFITGETDGLDETLRFMREQPVYTITDQERCHSIFKQWEGGTLY